MKRDLFLIGIITIFVIVLIAMGLMPKNTPSTVISNVSVNDLSSCKLITNVSARENCYFSLVLENKDSSICRLISDVSLRGDCYLVADSK